MVFNYLLVHVIWVVFARRDLVHRHGLVLNIHDAHLRNRTHISHNLLVQLALLADPRVLILHFFLLDCLALLHICSSCLHLNSLPCLLCKHLGLKLVLLDLLLLHLCLRHLLGLVVLSHLTHGICFGLGLEL